ncbi:DNA-cytosine methyltransferase (EC 2.1.1.37) [Methylomonas albis]|uniref:DNA (cytosine-5-)-methyltransferase n=1 Tax=Methylomonas albis TaxID=1854563 RepID=A0ABR9D5B6_9GAMM|nr:DNA cytosine methyltransferase [Methylomonas albis]MBD9358317.1 DNA cytosine methyltransferase [Methylomonas albis]CAD6881706.1 DNA-cytosine methyltransferase (EC 2.1.1.37) [Methylomonas albis]
MNESVMASLKAVDFFCGAGGMSYGLQTAGIKILAGIDNDYSCKETYETNITEAKFINKDISELEANELGNLLKINKNDNNLIFAGCSPCQYWSKVRTNKTKSLKSAFLLKNFERFIVHFRPGFVIVENVPGLATNKKQSILPDFIDFLQREGYSYNDGVINAVEYGVPQKRKRYLLIASRLTDNISLPTPELNPKLIVKNYLGVANGFNKIIAGHKDESDFQHTAAKLSEENLKRIGITPKSGGDRSSWKDNKVLQIPAYEGKDDIFRDVYARMYWDRPAPTITTRFNSFSNGRFGHPEEDRAISIREGATLQTFPKSFVFKGSNMACLARQIGNAVPPEIARRIGAHIINIAQNG